MNTHSVALKQIRLLYRWIIKGKLIDFRTNSIFRHPISENARNALDTYLNTFDWSKDDEQAIKDIKAFVDFYNIGLAEELKINDMVWSQLVKRYFQNGHIIEVLPGYQLVALMPVGIESPHLTPSPSAGVYMVPSTSVDLTSARRSNEGILDKKVTQSPEDKPVSRP